MLKQIHISVFDLLTIYFIFAYEVVKAPQTICTW